jgi:hypothetical protein
VDLRDQARGYLEAEGFTIGERARDLLIGTRRGLAEEPDVVYLWVLDAKKFGRSQEGPFLGRFKDAVDAHPYAQRHLLTTSTEGLSSEFKRGAKQWYNVNVRVPAQFFDTAFRWEESADAPSAAKDLQREGEALRSQSVDQPYELIHGGTTVRAGANLRGDLYSALAKPSGTRTIHLVVGPAGAGKSHMFSALFAQLYADFLKAKQEQRPHARPLPLLPQTLEFADGPTVKAALRAYLRTDFARPIDLPVLEWRLAHGWATWLIDGLDEVIAQDRTFFDYLEDLLTLPGGFPLVVICVRDSLLGSLPGLLDFVDDNESFVDMYRLLPWEAANKARLADIRLGARASDYIARLKESPALDGLASTAYYSSLLIDRFAAGDLKSGYAERELLDDALSAMIEREYPKTALDPSVVTPLQIREYLEALAAQDLADGFRGIAVEMAKELAFAHPHAVLVGDVRVPDGVLGIGADAIRDSVAQVRPHAMVRQVAIWPDIEADEFLAPRVGDDERGAIGRHRHPIREGDAIRHLPGGSIGLDQGDHAGPWLLAGHEV